MTLSQHQLNTTNENSILIRNANLILIIFSCAYTLFNLFYLLKYCHYGFNLTDESFYLIWITNPFLYKWSITQFGYIYHPLYLLFDGNIVALRQWNILFTFCLAWFLTSIFLHTIYCHHPLSKLERIVISSGFASASLMFLQFWVPTPSYNSLTLQALLISAIGILLINSNKFNLTGWLILAFGGWLTFMAKPSTAMLLAMNAGLYIFMTKKFVLRFFLPATFFIVLLFILSALLIDGSLNEFFNRFTTGLQFATYLNEGYSLQNIFRIGHFYLSPHEKLVLSYLTLLTFIAIYFLHSQKNALLLIGLLFTLSLPFFSLLTMFVLLKRGIRDHQFQDLLIMAVPFTVIGISLLKIKNIFKLTLTQWALAFTFFWLPYIFAFGTNRNYWRAGIPGILFWILAGLVILAPLAQNNKVWKMLLPLSLATQAIATALIFSSLDVPYHQPQSLRTSSFSMQLGEKNSALIFSTQMGDYLTNAIKLTQLTGFKPNTPVIDLTGRSPGLLYVIHAKSIGQAWAVGGFPGSNKVAVEALKKVPCEELSQAWVLLEKNPALLSLSPDVLESFGSRINTDYQLATSWVLPKEISVDRIAKIQQLMKPIRPSKQALEACKLQRMKV